jgi:hypothetical protein
MTSLDPFSFETLSCQRSSTTAAQPSDASVKSVFDVFQQFFMSFTSLAYATGDAGKKKKKQRFFIILLLGN